MRTHASPPRRTAPSPLVSEFRTLPGYYQPNEWRPLGLNFFKQTRKHRT